VAKVDRVLRISGGFEIMDARIVAALARFTSLSVSIDLEVLGLRINALVQDVGQLQTVTVGDLRLYLQNDGSVPTDVLSAMIAGSCFFDAVYYFGLEDAARPACLPATGVARPKDAVIATAKNRLLWTAIFLMLRGSYPESRGKTLGQDIPAFLVNICGMDESPADTAAGLASFSLQKINPGWIRWIEWSKMAPAIRQRLGLGLAGYRNLGPFRLYECRADAPAEARAAFGWIRNLLGSPPDYSILSCTRSARLISLLGSWNKALGNLMLLCFTPVELEEMVATKIIFQRPTHDPRADTWRAWVSGGPLVLTDPIGL
jgi:hypothetical protein